MEKNVGTRTKATAERMDALVELRTNAGYTIKGFADHIGVKASTYRSWESGFSGMSKKQLCLVADALGVSVDAVIGRVETDTDTAELMRLWRSMEKDARTRLLSAARVEVLLRENDEEEA